MAKSGYPPMTVTFEDGTEVTVEPRPKDVARAEIAGYDFQTGGPIVGTYAVALATLGRLSRSGVLPEGVKVPDTLEEFLDVADVDPDVEDDDAGEGSGQAPTSG